MKTTFLNLVNYILFIKNIMLLEKNIGCLKLQIGLLVISIGIALCFVHILSILNLMVTICGTDIAPNTSCQALESCVSARAVWFL